MNDKPLVTIITTYYNSVRLGDFVNKSMKYLLNQTYKNIEFVCVNDGSQDETLEQLKSYAEKDTRIKIVNKENQGVAQYAKGAGQEVASGDWIMLFDHDDTLSADAIEKAVKKANDNPELDAVSMQIVVKYSDGKVRGYHQLDLFSKLCFQNVDRKLSGWEAYKKTVGRFDFYFRGIIKREKNLKHNYAYTEKLLNGDEIVGRLMVKDLNQIGICEGVYEHIIYSNSSAKSYSMKKIDMVRSNVILKELFQQDQVYEERKDIFELNAYKVIIDGVKIFQNLKNATNPEDRKKYYEYLRSGYDQLDKKVVLKQYNGLKRVYHSFILSSFSMMMFYYGIKKN